MTSFFRALDTGASGGTGAPPVTCPNDSTCEQPASCPCESPTPSQCEGNYSNEPIRYSNGDIQMSVTDLLVEGFGQSWGQERSYCNQLQVAGIPTSVNFGSGYNWVVRQFAYLVDTNGDGSVIQVVVSPRETYLFHEVGGVYVGAYGALQSLKYDATNGLYQFATTNGTVWLFFDFASTTNPPGMLYQVITPGAQTLTLSYPNSTSPVSEIERNYAESDGSTTAESFIYKYLSESDENAGLLSIVTLRRKTSGSGWNCIRQVSYTYYGSDSRFGGLGDLATATRQLATGAGDWADIDTSYYRYYVDDASGTGFAHGLKYALEPEAFRRLAASVTDPFSATDSQVAQFADYFFQYDSNQRVVMEQVAAASRTYLFSYTSSGNPEGYNSWQQKTIESLPDGSQNTVFTNHIGQVMLKKLTSGARNWTKYRYYDETLASILLAAEPSAVQGYDESLPDLGGPSGVLYPAQGFVRSYTYYTTTTATPSTPGGATGYLQYEQVQQGRSSFPVKLSQKTYFQRSTTDDDPAALPVTIFPVATKTAFQSDNSIAPQPSVTSYIYSWFFATVQLQQKVTTLPVITTAQNGSNIAATQQEQYDVYGNMIWEQGPRGFIDTFTYVVPTAAMEQMIEDVDPATITLPLGWSRPSGLPAPLNLVTDYKSDELGRITQSLGPTHSVNAVNARTAMWSLYLDAQHQIWSGQGFATGNPGGYHYSLVNPVTLSFLDNANRVVNSVQAARCSINGPLSATDCFPQVNWTRWTANLYNNAGQHISQRAYHTIPPSGLGNTSENYDETIYGYDIMDRLNRIVTPGGTITRTTYDPRGLVTATFIGTTDSGANDASPATSGGPGNNMVQVTTYVYDGAGDGRDGTLTETSQIASSTSVRTWNFTYDFRNRRISVSAALNFYQHFTYNNLGRIVQIDRKDGSGGNLVARSQTILDNQGRIYQSIVYGVDPTTGTVGNALTSNNWYDEAGNLIKAFPAGSQQFTKSLYDSQARIYAVYQGYYTASGVEPYNEVGQVTGQNKIFEQSLFTYVAAQRSPIMAAVYERFDDTSGNGALNPPTGSQPLARVNYIANYYDGIGRLSTSANYGTNGNVALIRSGTAPVRSDSVLVTSLEYDDAGNQFQKSDPEGIITRREFNSLGSIVAIISNYSGGCPGDCKDVTSRVAYNSDGNIVTLTAVNSTTGDQVTTYVYGSTLANSDIASNDLLVATIYPGSSGGTDQLAQTFNRQGQVTTLSDQNGNVHEYLYDLLGRPTDDVVSTLGDSVDGSVRRIGRSYEVRGLVEQITSYSSPDGTAVVNQIENYYNSIQQLVTQFQEHNGAVNTSTSPQVDYSFADGTNNTVRPTGLVYPNGRVLSYLYAGDGDPLSRISSYLDVAGGTTLVQYAYLGLGTFVQSNAPQPNLTWTMKGGSGANPYIGLDEFGRVINCLWTNGTGVIDQIQYGYNCSGSRTWRKDPVASSQTPPVYQDELYSYDAVQRLVDMSRGQLTNGNSQIANLAFAQQWRLDATGNWSRFVNTDTSTASNSLDQQRTSNQVNEITAIRQRYGATWAQAAYDQAGNMMTIPNGNDPTIAVNGVYDAWNRLVSITSTVSYAYDGLNRCINSIASGTTRNYYYSAQWQVLEERVSSANSVAKAKRPSVRRSMVSSGDAERQFVWGLRYIDDLILRDRDSSGSDSLTERLYAVQDANWNVTAIVDTVGDVHERYRYVPYGIPSFLYADFSPASQGGNYSWSNLFSGYRWDSESGLYLARNRLLNSTIGTWLSRDPLGVDAGFNLYQYVGSTPLNYFDPSGLEPEPCPVPDPRLTFTPESWGGWGTGVKSKGNCWRFATCQPTPDDGDPSLVPRPEMGWKNGIINCVEALDAAASAPNAELSDATTPCKKCSYKIVVLVASKQKKVPVFTGSRPIDMTDHQDVHFMRQQPDMTWAQVTGNTSARTVDASGNKITDPSKANNDYSRTNLTPGVGIEYGLKYDDPPCGYICYKYG